jgi:hypothetical protein
MRTGFTSATIGQPRKTLLQRSPESAPNGNRLDPIPDAAAHCIGTLIWHPGKKRRQPVAIDRAEVGDMLLPNLAGIFPAPLGVGVPQWMCRIQIATRSGARGR